MENGKRDDGHARARDCNLGIVCKNGEFAGIRWNNRLSYMQYIAARGGELLCCICAYPYRGLSG